ncbi:hypothetical protein DFR86_04765 [Acidianus sulfidivorans JP7]|uniref:FoxD n=1 Tax=Acidianus sulfidivorans JP7 TaxID=619593 RepID=A0A2U9ILK9_9CREN|nr:hypothetical protein [Acidianus sulfidivorans]AWR96938.1 hypothetical protein DFR86_04765 [Acidianus sulfidivorans JP7]
MKKNIFVKDINFLYLLSILFVFSLLFELLFNREFLAGTIPIGYASEVNPMVGEILDISFPIGAVAFGLVLILEPILIGGAVIYSKLSKTTKGLLATSLYLSLLLDAVHWYYGVNNTAFQPPVLFSLFYVTILISTIVMSSYEFGNFLIFTLLLPDFIAYFTLIGSWLVEISRISALGNITFWSAVIMPYSIMFSGTVFIIYSLYKALKLRTLSKGYFALFLAFVSLGILIGSVVYLNLIPGLGIMIGIMFPYILGILGIANWMPPFLFGIAIIAIGAGLIMYKIDKAMSFFAFSLFFGALIFDSVSTTVYLLIPLSAVVIYSLMNKTNKLKNKI